MCGRFIITSPVDSLAEIFGFEERPNLAPRYNIAPTQDVAAVRIGEDGKRHLALLHWGLVPFWAKDPSVGARMINARAESVAEKPAFRAAFRHRRCLIPANGFYEWKKAADGAKQPYLIQRPGGAPFAFAGLWEHWEDKQSGSPLESCTIITTDANQRLSAVHHRMPVVLDETGQDAWLLADSAEASALGRLLKPAPESYFELFPVSRDVNKVANDSPELLEPVSLEEGEVGQAPPKKAKAAQRTGSSGKKNQGELF